MGYVSVIVDRCCFCLLNRFNHVYSIFIDIYSVALTFIYPWFGNATPV